MRLTKKQRMIIQAVIVNEEEHGPDVHQICDQVNYDVTKDAMMFSLRFLVKRGLVKKGEQVMRRERWVIPYTLTSAAEDIFLASKRQSAAV